MRTESNLNNLLVKAENEDLKTLCDILTTNKKGNRRFNECLTTTAQYSSCYPHKMQELVPEIINELQHYGANTVMTTLRLGDGVPYKVILRDVAKKLKVSFNKNTSEENIERYILQKLFADIANKLSEEELRELANNMRIKVATNCSKNILIGVLQAAIRRGGFQSYIWITITANAITRAILGRGLSFATNAFLMRLTSILAGPIGITLNALWLAIDLAGPAYRVTIPAVVQIAYIRAKSQRSVCCSTNI